VGGCACGWWQSIEKGGERERPCRDDRVGSGWRDWPAVGGWVRRWLAAKYRKRQREREREREVAAVTCGVDLGGGRRWSEDLLGGSFENFEEKWWVMSDNT
jgi:hypothetical protein